MKKSKLSAFGALLSLSLLWLQCTNGNTIAGGSSDTEVSARISGIVTDANGDVVAGVNVRLRRDDYLPSSAMSKEKTVLSNKIDAVTDEKGYFQLDSVDSGSYLIEFSCGDTIGSVVEYAMSGNEQCTLAPVLVPFGMVVGRMDFFYEGKEILSKARVELIGTETMTRPDSNGFFKLPVPVPLLPPGTPNHYYRIRMSVDSSFFAETVVSIALDSVHIGNLGVVRLNYSLPPPCMDGRCDSMILREFLDDAGHPDVSVETVTQWKRGRIDVLNLRGLTIPIPLAPLGSISNLTVLDLGNTGTADSCRFIMGLWYLMVLSLDSNAITGLSHAFEGAYGLLELSVADNRLTSLPEKIGSLTRLRKLDLTGNALCNLSPVLENWAEMLNPGWRETQRCP